ncbi:MAG: head-tail adaptor protein [Phreatobacter sp.]|uniref:head-tail adaptor protein n=1 Tax=Phreatobacter sp. TaxID=1966341 RepID=UPI001A49D5CD|nr:head-tail adaptor protein [Phreatobacter sp.]MBL8568724.1 head-tail adaptor protein [Phreatobacter sp.]
MTVGTLRHRLTVEAPAEIADGAGGVARTFAAVGEIWGLIQPMGGTETRAEERLVQRLTHAIVIRPFAGLSAAHRLRKGARIFDIRAIREDTPSRLYATCHCEEIAP